MTDREDFIIDRPYTLTGDDIKAINAASPGENDKDDWEKDDLDDFKERLRDYLWEHQNGRCAYCRLKLHDHIATPEIEHIVPKSKKPQWMYEPFNLCLSCKRCNTIKGYRKKILEDLAVNATSLPHASDDYRLIHPYIDRYSDNIELLDGIIYRGKTTKGENTIKICGLDRFQVAAARADALIAKNSNEYVRLMLLIENPRYKGLVKNMGAFKKRIKLIIRDYVK
ncbi:HNH endonuclease [Prevotella sp. tf2-5]|uniref:HNH endonuclease n=1 Tax=Prevotella sp. tf2-5 TaxID=1761889 RepID=UPI0008F028AD|nr:HNH endonuclease [Prevotella sp. tf2-5]SFP03123.1 TIGR02646 family protein [Prevotella sp. tf2-5]